jgi:gliding motility-associated lipoprotein GldH
MDLNFSDLHKRLLKCGHGPFLVFLAILISTLSSCDNKAIYDNTKSIKDNVWNVDDPVIFKVPVKDTLAVYNFYLNIRHTTDYRFANIYFFVTSIYPDGHEARDTVECILADRQGKWFGKGISNIRDDQILLRRGLRFPEAGTYTFEFEQAMREKELPGIKDIGLRIEKAF